MKNTLLFILILSCTITQAQIVDIPDANFKYALVNENVVDNDGNNSGESDADLNNDGEIQVSEAEAVLGLVVGFSDISSLEGIKSFTNLIWLNCRNNNLIELDITHNTSLLRLFSQSNSISGAFNTSQNIVLAGITVHNNSISSLDLSNNPNLEVLGCGDNLITEIDLSQNPYMHSLYCANNQISEIDISNNPNFKEIICSSNQLTSLNIQNGNAENIDSLNSTNNSNLFCIQVDNIEYANYVTWWIKDDWTDYSVDCNLGAEDFNQTYFTLYPNPTNEILNIDSQFPIDKVQIYTLQGVLVKEPFTKNINVSEFSPGIYFLSVTSNGRNQTKKFIKK